MPRLNNALLSFEGILQEFNAVVVGKHICYINVLPEALDQQTLYIQRSPDGALTCYDVQLAAINTLRFTMSEAEFQLAIDKQEIKKQKFSDLKSILQELGFDVFDQKNEHPFLGFQKRLRNLYDKYVQDDHFSESFAVHYPGLKQLIQLILELEERDYRKQQAVVLAVSCENDWRPNKNDIEERYRDINDELEYFSDECEDKALELYELLVIHLHVNICVFENSGDAADAQAYDFSYRLMAMLLSEDELLQQDIDSLIEVMGKRVEDLLKTLPNYKKLNQPYHDLLIDLSLPDASELTSLEGWRELIRREGTQVLRYFMRAIDIEKIYQRKINAAEAEDNVDAAQEVKEGEEKQVINLSPTDYLHAKELAADLSYSRANEDAELATICSKYNVTTQRFAQCLRFINGVWPKKNKDDLPKEESVTTIGDKNYHWVKLSPHDKRALIMGDISGCCQSIGNSGGQSCAIQAATLPGSAVYVLLVKRKGGEGKDFPRKKHDKINDKDYMIIAQAYTWKSSAGNICMDSIETLSRATPDIIKKSLAAFAEQIMRLHPQVKRITVGTGGKTPKSLFETAVINEEIAAGSQYSDSRLQYIIRERAIDWSKDEIAKIKRVLKPYKENIKALIHYYFLHKTVTSDQAIIELNQAIQSPGLMENLTYKKILSLLASSEDAVLVDLIPINFSEMKLLKSEEKYSVINSLSTARLKAHHFNIKDLLMCMEYFVADKKKELLSFVNVFQVLKRSPELIDQRTFRHSESELIQDLFSSSEPCSIDDYRSLFYLLNHHVLILTKPDICMKIGMLIVNHPQVFEGIKYNKPGYRFYKKPGEIMMSDFYKLADYGEMTTVCIKLANELKLELERVIHSNFLLTESGIENIKNYYYQKQRVGAILQAATRYELDFPQSEEELLVRVLQLCEENSTEILTIKKLHHYLDMFFSNSFSVDYAIKKEFLFILLCHSMEKEQQDIIINCIKQDYLVDEWWNYTLQGMPLVNSVLLQGNIVLLDRIRECLEINNRASHLENIEKALDSEGWDSILALTRNNASATTKLLEYDSDYFQTAIIRYVTTSEVVKNTALNTWSVFLDYYKSKMDVLDFLNKIWQRMPTSLLAGLPLFSLQILQGVNGEKLVKFLTKQRESEYVNCQLHDVLLEKLCASASSSGDILRLLNNCNVKIGEEYLPQLLKRSIEIDWIFFEITRMYSSEQIIKACFIEEKCSVYGTYPSALHYCAASPPPMHYLPNDKNHDSREMQLYKFRFLSTIILYIQRLSDDEKAIFHDKITAQNLSLEYNYCNRKVSVLSMTAHILGTPNAFSLLFSTIPRSDKLNTLFKLTYEEGERYPHCLLVEYCKHKNSDNIFLLLPRSLGIEAMIRCHTGEVDGNLNLIKRSLFGEAALTILDQMKKSISKVLDKDQLMFSVALSLIRDLQKAFSREEKNEIVTVANLKIMAVLNFKIKQLKRKLLSPESTDKTKDIFDKIEVALNKYILNNFPYGDPGSTFCQSIFLQAKRGEYQQAVNLYMLIINPNLLNKENFQAALQVVKKYIFSNNSFMKYLITECDTHDLQHLGLRLSVDSPLVDLCQLGRFLRFN